MTIGYRRVTSLKRIRAVTVSESSTAFTNADTFSDRNDRIDVERWRRSSHVTDTADDLRRLRSDPAAYSESVRFGDTYTRQRLNRRQIELSHSPMPASPV